MQFSYTWSSLFVCTLLARARMSKLKSQIHQLIMDFVTSKVTTVTGFRIVNKFAAFYLTLLSNCGSILAIATEMCKFFGNFGNRGKMCNFFGNTGNRGKICEFSGEPPATSLEQSY